MDQLSFASLDYAEEEAHEARCVFSRDGSRGALGGARSFDRAALSQGWSERRSATISIGRDATDLLLAAVV
jgi:hypothetical protein